MLVKRSVHFDGNKTSVSLEEPYWREVKRLAHQAGQTIGEYVGSIRATKGMNNLSSALRLAVVADLQAQLARFSTSTQPDKSGKQ